MADLQEGKRFDLRVFIQESSVLEISRSSMSYGLQWVVPTMWMVCYVPGSQPRGLGHHGLCTDKRGYVDRC